MLHELKIKKKYADDVLNGKKTFELRYFDRNYEMGDRIHFTVVDEDQEYYEHDLNYKFYKITYIVDENELPKSLYKGWCILGIEPYSNYNWRTSYNLYGFPLSRF